MKVCYLTWGETPRSYGIFGSQVIGQFVETYKLMREEEFFFIAAVPLIHSGLIREKWAYFSELKRVRQRLSNIKFFRIPIFASQTFVNSSKRTFYLFHGFSHWLLSKRLKKLKPDVVHCRSYHAAWAALKVKEKYHLKYSIVFDGRGLWPEEVAMKNNYAETDKNYRYLKKIEKELLLKCNINIAVSDTMKEHYEKIGASKVELLYLSVSANKLRPEFSNTDTVKKDDEYIFCYIGALTKSTWHTIDKLKELYKRIKETCSFKTKILIITTSDHSIIKEVFGPELESELELTSTKTTEELKSKLSRADFGLLPYKDVSDNIELSVGLTMLGTKTVEYLAAGLPVIVNKYCGGAASIIEKYNLGVVYDPKTFNEINNANISNFINDFKQVERSDLAEELFDYEVNAEKYKEIYLNS